METIKMDKKSLNELIDFTYKADSGQGKPTMVLLLNTTAWDKVKTLFNSDGLPIDDSLKAIRANGYVWTLYAQSYMKSGVEMHKIYGTSGDYTFGNAPRHYQQRYSGNKRVAIIVFNYFIDKYLK
jgi:aspartate-semialdehyde dehydrogenase